MSAQVNHFRLIPDRRLVPLSFLILLVCLFYTCAAAYLAPYPGFDLDSSWVLAVLEPCPAKATWCQANQDVLQVGDRLLAIGDLTYDDFWNDGSSVPFASYGPGDVVSIRFRRAGVERIVDWRMFGPTAASRAHRLIRTMLFFAPFWFAGTAILLFLQPRDLRWRLLIVANYVVAIWLAVGVFSLLRVAYASLVQHALAWLLAPVAIHLHLALPTLLFRRQQRYFLPPFYAVAAIFAGLELVQALPRTAFYVGPLLTFAGSLGLLVFRMLSRPSPKDRVALRLMFAGIALSLGPCVILWVVPAFLGTLVPRGVTLNIAELAIPLLPFSYLYAIFKRRLGALEFRANRLFSVYSFALLYATVFTLIFTIGGVWLDLSGHSVLFGLLVSIVFVVAAPYLHGRFQRLVDRLAYGTEHNPNDIMRVFADRIPAAVSLDALAELLAGEVAPSLLIQQSALCLIGDEGARLVYARGVGQHEMPETRQQVERLVASAGRFQQPSAAGQGALTWVRLVVPVEAREETMGLWLFGRRDPDDYYPERDIELLSTLARQVAVAVENARLYREIREHSEFLEQRVRERTAQIQAQYAQLAAILNSASDGIIVTNRRGETVRANQVAEIWLTESLSVADAVRLREAVRALAVRVGAAEPAVAGPGADEVVHATLELEGLDLELRAAAISPLGDDDAVTVVSIHDVSHLKALDRIKTRFISNVSHELRTPVTTVRLYAHLMQRASPEESKTHLATLAREVDQLAQLINEIVEVSRIDAERLNIQLRPTSLSELAELAITRYRALALERRLTLETRLAGGGPMALVDSDHMMQVLSTLVENAIQYTPAEGKVVIYTGTERAEGRIWATATVADTGIGIPEGELPHVFERFFRGEKPRIMQVPGTGLGLSIAKEIVDLHGGHMTVESREEVGTSFTVWLPYIEVEA